MADPFAPRVGAVMSADIAVPEHERVVRFYARVLGTGEHPLWREDLMNNRGTPVIGLGARSAEYADLPMQWMPHVQVADVARSVERALALGASEVMHGKGDDGASLWAALLDPDGAAFGVIPVVTEDQLPPKDSAAPHDEAASLGCIAWLELTVADAAATRDFYQEVIGWSARDAESEGAGERDADYVMLGGDGKPAAGVRHARGANQALPPVWLMHLPVGDLAESLRRVREGGGKVLEEAAGADGACARAVVEDPVGVCLALVPG